MKKYKVTVEKDYIVNIDDSDDFENDKMYIYDMVKSGELEELDLQGIRVDVEKI